MAFSIVAIIESTRTLPRSSVETSAFIVPDLKPFLYAPVFLSNMVINFSTPCPVAPVIPMDAPSRSSTNSFEYITLSLFLLPFAFDKMLCALVRLSKAYLNEFNSFRCRLLA